jgi:hypothetical protein
MGKSACDERDAILSAQFPLECGPIEELKFRRGGDGDRDVGGGDLAERE